jgi:hypothetical protein
MLEGQPGGEGALLPDRAMEWCREPDYSKNKGLSYSNTLQLLEILLRRSGQIRRLTRGVYEFPKIHPRIGVFSPSPEAVAKAMAERTGSRFTISGAKAANPFGSATKRSRSNTLLLPK